MISRYTLHIPSPALITWLKAQGAPENTLSTFILEKGCGERIELGYIGSDVTIHLYGNEHINQSEQLNETEQNGKDA